MTALTDREAAVVVLAAGMGSRFGGPKQVAAVGPNGETLLEYSVFDAARAGFGKAVFVIRSAFERTFCRQLLPRFADRLDVQYVLQDQTARSAGIGKEAGGVWGTAHALLAAEEKISQPFVVLNADDYYGSGVFTAAYEALRQRRRSSRGSFFLVSFELGKTLSPHGPVARGICTLDGSRLTTLVEHASLQESNGKITDRGDGTVPPAFEQDSPVSMNFWGFTPDVFRLLRPLLDDYVRGLADGLEDEFRLPDAIAELIRRGVADVEVIPAGGEWFGMTYAADLERVRLRVAELVDAGTYPRSLWAERE